MADYYGKTRTNYFSVTNEEKFKQIINSCGAENGGIIIADQKQNDGSVKYCFYCDGSIYGLPDRNETDEYCEDDDAYIEYDYDAFCATLQEIISDGDAIIITHIGSEKMRYLIGGCSIITRNDYEYVDLTNEALKLAKNLLNNPDFTTQMEY